FAAQISRRVLRRRARAKNAGCALSRGATFACLPVDIAGIWRAVVAQAARRRHALLERSIAAVPGAAHAALGGAPRCRLVLGKCIAGAGPRTHQEHDAEDAAEQR